MSRTHCGDGVSTDQACASSGQRLPDGIASMCLSRWGGGKVFIDVVNHEELGGVWAGGLLALGQRKR